MPPTDPNRLHPLTSDRGPVRAVETHGDCRRVEYFRPGAPTVTAYAWGIVTGLVLGWILVSWRGL